MNWRRILHNHAPAFLPSAFGYSKKATQLLSGTSNSCEFMDENITHSLLSFPEYSIADIGGAMYNWTAN